MNQKEKKELGNSKFEEYRNDLHELLVEGDFAEVPKKEDLKPDTSFVNDLGLDSLDVIEVIMEVESKYSIVISDLLIEDIHTLGDLVGVIHSLRV